MRRVINLLKFLIELATFLVIGYLLVGATYYFGWTFLLDGTSLGNDHASAMQSIFYLDRWFPSLPSWNYLWTGGMPSFSLYPFMGMFLTFLIHKLTGLTIIAASRVFLFSSIALSAVGVALLARILVKNWLIGLIAGVIMLLSPDTWLWATYSGFFAAASTPAVFAFLIAAFVWAAESRKPQAICLAAFLYGLSWTFHPLAGMLALVVFFFIGWGYGIRDWGFKKSWKGILLAVGTAVLGAALFAWWILPFFMREEIGGIGLAAKDMYRDTFKELVGLEPPAASFVTGTFFSLGPIVLFFAGGLVALLRRSILVFAFMACLGALFIMTAPGYAQPIVETFNLFWTSTNVRSALILRIFGPILGAYAAASIVRPIFWLIEKLLKRLKTNFLWQNFQAVISGVCGIVIVYLVVKNFIFVPSYFNSPDWAGGMGGGVYDGYGPIRNWIVTKKEGDQLLVYNPTINQFELLYKDPQTIFSEIPKIIEIAGINSPILSVNKPPIKQAFEKADLTEHDRIDIPPVKGEVAGSIGLYSPVSEIPCYMGTSLIQPMWGWQIDCTYWNDVCGGSQIEDLARWWGIKQVWLAEIQPPDIMARFAESPLFEMEKQTLKVKEPSGIVVDYPWHWYNFTDSTGLASISNKPAILVIGDNPPNNDVYDIVFRDLTKINFGYKDAWSVRGKQYIDDYRLTELSQYDAIILYGYRYHNRQKAWNLLEKYVQEGGALFVDTGWQYYSQDWGLETGGKIQALEMPKIIPVKKTVWEKTSGSKWSLAFGEDPILQEANLDDWGEPLYFGQSWGMAVAKEEDLQNGAKVLLKNGDKVLSAYWEIGKGKVFWTGFDYWGHLVQYKAPSEREMVQKIMFWLVGGKGKEQKLDYKRVSPDYISIKFDKLEGKNKLMFKEVASQNWRARLKDQNGQTTPLKINKAGPGWKLVFIPDMINQGEIIFSYHRGKIEYLGILVTIGSFLFVAGWLFMAVTKKKLFFFDRIKSLVVKRSSNLKRSWSDEEN